MRILFDIVHPANVFFFRKPIEILMARGDDIHIVSRHKDVTCELLDTIGLSHVPISTAGIGKTGLARELALREWRLWREVRGFRPDIMIGFGGVAISHVGKLAGIPAIAFYDTDTATLQNRITWPFISHLYIPETYAGPFPEQNTTRFPGCKEACYFHPDNFEVRPELARAVGWDEDRPNYFVRTVQWRANHDIGKAGWSDATLFALVDHLGKKGKVHLSSERDLPPELHRHLYSGAKDQIHQLIAQCDLYVGESATMASEAAFLGTPAIYDGRDHPGVTLELAAQGMITALGQPGTAGLLDAVDKNTAVGAKEAFLDRRGRYLKSLPNLANYIVEALDRHAARN